MCFAVKRLLQMATFMFLLLMFVGCGESEDISSSAQETTPPTATATPAATIVMPEIEEYSFNPLTGEEPISGQDPGTRPIAVMVDNIERALPQTGLSLADVIIEAETEGGITRLMAMYSDPNAITAVGPVRSVRDQFCEIAMSQNAIIVNIGSSKYANDLLNYYGYQTVDGLYLGTTSFTQDTARAGERGNEHSWYTDSAQITAGMTQNNISATGGFYPLFNFAREDDNVSENYADVATTVDFEFSHVASGNFVYSEDTGTYAKFYGGIAQTDVIDNAQLAFDNLILLYMDVTTQPDGLVTKFEMTEGEGYYFNGGKYTEITWEKGNPDAQLKLFDDDGEELEVATGKSYIALVSKTREDTLVIK